MFELRLYISKNISEPKIKKNGLARLPYRTFCNIHALMWKRFFFGGLVSLIIVSRWPFFISFKICYEYLDSLCETKFYDVFGNVIIAWEIKEKNKYTVWLKQPSRLGLHINNLWHVFHNKDSKSYKTFTAISALWCSAGCLCDWLNSVYFKLIKILAFGKSCQYYDLHCFVLALDSFSFSSMSLVSQVLEIC